MKRDGLPLLVLEAQSPSRHGSDGVDDGLLLFSPLEPLLVKVLRQKYIRYKTKSGARRGAWGFRS